jgi:AraC-like DNA-binding protein
MPSQVNDSLWRAYRRALAKGEIANAHNIALEAARLYEENDDLKAAGSWRRAVASCLYYRGRYGEAAIEAERSAEIQLDPYERARSLILLGESHVLSLKSNAAFIALGKAEEIARFFRDDDYLNARIYSFRAYASGSTGDLDQAIVDGGKGAALDQQSGRLLKAAGALNNLGLLLAKQRVLKGAEQRLVWALELIEKEPEPFCEGCICDSLGYVYTLMGRHDDAERLLTKSAEIFKRLANDAELAASLLHLSELHQRMRQRQGAREEAVRALRLATESGVERLRVDASNLLLSIESDTHRYPRNGNPNVQRVRDLINDNLQGTLRLKEMARAIYLSPSRLEHLFKTETGASLGSYIKAARMEKARELLETTLLSVKEVMGGVGLSDGSHFLRDFKRRYGVTPTQYRRRSLTEKSLAKRAGSIR